MVGWAGRTGKLCAHNDLFIAQWSNIDERPRHHNVDKQYRKATIKAVRFDALWWPTCYPHTHTHHLPRLLLYIWQLDAHVGVRFTRLGKGATGDILPDYMVSFALSDHQWAQNNKRWLHIIIIARAPTNAYYRENRKCASLAADTEACCPPETPKASIGRDSPTKRRI